MGVSLFKDSKDSDRLYYRVTRAWGGEEHQFYVRVKRSQKAAERKAKELDQKLADKQKAFFLRQQLTEDRFFHPNGKIVGLNRAIRYREGRKPVDEFKLRVKLADRERPQFTTISIQTHGVEAAYEMAIEKICEWCGIDGRSEIKKKMKESLVHYQTPEENPEGKMGLPEAKPEGEGDASGLIDRMSKEVKSFLASRRKR